MKRKLLILFLSVLLIPKSPAFATQSQGVEITAKVEEKKVQYTITVIIIGKGNVYLSTNKAAAGEVVTLSIEELSGYEFSHFVGCSSNGIIIMPEHDVTIQAYFTKIKNPGINPVPPAPVYRPTPTNMPIPTNTPTSTPKATITPVPTKVLTVTPRPTWIPVVTNTPVSTIITTPMPISTPEPTNIVVTNTPIPTSSPVPSAPVTPTVSSAPESTVTLTLNPMGMPVPTVSLSPTNTPELTKLPTPTVEIKITPSEVPVITNTPIPTEFNKVTNAPITVPEETVTPSPTVTLLPTVEPALTNTPIPTKLQEELPGRIKHPMLIIIGVGAAAFSGIMLLLLLLFRRKRRWHGVFSEEMIPGTVIKGSKDVETKEYWFIPNLLKKMEDGQITVEEYIESVKHYGITTLLPSDTVMTLVIAGEIITMSADEEKFFQILKETGQEVQLTLTSVKSGMKISMEYKVQ